MSKKRTSLDSILSRTVEVEPPPAPLPATPEAAKRPDVRQQTAYLPLPIHEQLRRLAFEERAKMHDYLLEGLDLVFRKRGLPGVEELCGKAK